MMMLSRRSGLLFGVVLAVCAFVVPMASAASWSAVGTTHQLTSTNLAFSQAIGGGLTTGISCAATQFDSDVTTAAVLTITAGRFVNCRGTGIAAGCTLTGTGTRFPWTATAPTTTSIQIHNIHIDWRYETAPGGGTGSCNALVHNTNSTWTGTLTGGVWDPSSIGANRRITFVNASGLVSHSVIANGAPTLVNGTFFDPTGTLNLLD
ncbi:MAG TPA: hypothetical protein VFY45_07480 [Baekduia sp.]|nr:hypothetical protein [Baekduia sp.]